MGVSNYTIELASFAGRENIPYMLNKMGLVGEAVEIGTHRGDYARSFLDRWNGRLLYCVDPWSTPVGYEDQAAMLWGGGDRLKDYHAFVDAVGHHKHRTQALRCLSSEALESFKGNSLDFIYIDGDHKFDMVLFDLVSWWEKLKPGGVIAGHDIICPGEKNGGWGQEIQPAVLGFAHEYKVNVHLVLEVAALPWSYYLIKP